MEERAQNFTSDVVYKWDASANSFHFIVESNWFVLLHGITILGFTLEAMLVSSKHFSDLKSQIAL